MRLLLLATLVLVGCGTCPSETSSTSPDSIADPIGKPSLVCAPDRRAYAFTRSGTAGLSMVWPVAPEASPYEVCIRRGGAQIGCHAAPEFLTDDWVLEVQKGDEVVAQAPAGAPLFARLCEPGEALWLVEWSLSERIFRQADLSRGNAELGIWVRLPPSSAP